MTRQEKALDLRVETWKGLEQIRKALGHDELEETVQLLVNLGEKVVAVTDKNHPMVHIMGGERKVDEVTCLCGAKFKRVLFTRETSVKLRGE